MEHGTPAEIVELARYVGGSIGTDPFSSAYWNHYSVGAATFYDREHSGLLLTNPWRGFVLLNPPGGDKQAGTRSLVRPAWERLVDEWRHGRIDGGVYVAYSLEQLCQLQGSPAHPLQFPTLVPCERLRFLNRPAAGGPPTPGTQPTHGNAVILLPSRRDPFQAKAQLARFLERGGPLGAVVRPF
jgi:hypothetical protein